MKKTTILKNSKKVIYKIFFIILFYNIDKLQLEKIKSEEMRRWQANWEDEEINDNFENVLKQELTAHGQKLPLSKLF